MSTEYASKLKEEPLYAKCIKQAGFGVGIVLGRVPLQTRTSRPTCSGSQCECRVGSQEISHKGYCS
jgi:hypothetical protein